MSFYWCSDIGFRDIRDLICSSLIWYLQTYDVIQQVILFYLIWCDFIWFVLILFDLIRFGILSDLWVYLTIFESCKHLIWQIGDLIWFDLVWFGLIWFDFNWILQPRDLIWFKFNIANIFPTYYLKYYNIFNILKKCCSILEIVLSEIQHKKCCSISKIVLNMMLTHINKYKSYPIFVRR